MGHMRYIFLLYKLQVKSYLEYLNYFYLERSLVAFYFYNRGEVVGGVAAILYKIDKLVFIQGEFSAISLGPLFILYMGVDKPIKVYYGASTIYNQVYVVNKAKV